MALPARPFEGTERFRVLRQIGEGGMGVVYEAHDRELDSRVALKTLRTREPRAILRLKNEFRALRDLQHPNLVSFGELFESAGNWFFSMELVHGSDLLSWVGVPVPDLLPTDTVQLTPNITVVGPPNAGAPRAPELPIGPAPFDDVRLREGLRQLARGLNALHDAGKVHRDIKPSNILVTAEPRVVLLDFGLVSDLIDNAREGDDEVAGTFVFMAPEQTLPNPVGPPADWYAVGVLLYIALTGRPPILGAGNALLELKRTFEPRPPRTIAPGVPSDLNLLCMELLQIDPARRPNGAEVLRRLGAEPTPPSSRVTSTSEAPFVGREQELRELRAAFEETRAGRAMTVLVHGESGVGKSTLVRRFADELLREEKGAVVLKGRCYERESVPYKAIDEIVDGLSRHLKRLPAVDAAALLPRMASLLTHVFPVLLDVEPFAAAPRVQHELADPQELRARVFVALRELLARLSDRHPVVLVIDDLQWADADSLLLLAEVLRPPLPPAMLLIGTVRTVSGSTTTERTFEHRAAFLSDARHVWLQNLPRSEARKLVGLLAHTPEGEQQIDANAIVAESEGHPLFIDVLIRHRHLHGNSATGPRLEEALCERVNALDLVERKILEVIAVAGRPLSQALIARAGGIDLGQLSEAAAHLRRANFVRSDGVRSTDAIEPYHDRVRRAIYDNLSPARLAQCHERLALAMEASGAADSEALAVHWEGAGERGRAADYAVIAAARAAKALAFDRAAELYRNALGLHPFEANKEREIRTLLAEALANAGRSAEAAEAFRAAVAFAKGPDALELTRRAAEQLLISGHIAEGLAEVHPVLAAAGLRLPTTSRRALVSLLFRRARIRLRGVGFRERDASEIAPSVLKLIDLTFSVSQGLVWVDVIRGAEFQTRHVLLALRAGEPYRLARALAIEAGFAATSGGRGPRRAARLLEIAQTLSEKSGQAHALGFVLTASGFASLAQGRWREAHDLNERAETIFAERCTGTPWELAFCRTNLLWGMCMLGRLGELGSRGFTYAEMALGRGDLFARASLICGPVSLAFLARDNRDAAEREVDGAIAHWSQGEFFLQHFYALVARSNGDLYAGDPRRAYRRLVETWPRLQQSFLLHFQITRIQALEMRARVAAALAMVTRGAEQKRLLDETARWTRRIQAERFPFCQAMTMLLRAEQSLARGEAESANTLFSDATLALDALEMSAYASAARRRRGLLVGGEEGRALVVKADQHLVENGVRNPERFAAIYAPEAPG